MNRREAVKYSEKLFNNGKNCAQSVSIAVFSYFDKEVSFVDKIASAFGGGIVDNKEICGALSGAFMSIGYFVSDYDKMLRLKNKLYTDFKTEFKETKCHYLINDESFSNSLKCNEFVTFCTYWCVNNIHT